MLIEDVLGCWSRLFCAYEKKAIKHKSSSTMVTVETLCNATSLKLWFERHGKVIHKNSKTYKACTCVPLNFIWVSFLLWLSILGNATQDDLWILFITSQKKKKCYFLLHLNREKQWYHCLTWNLGKSGKLGLLIPGHFDEIGTTFKIF